MRVAYWIWMEGSFGSEDWFGIFADRYCCFRWRSGRFDIYETLHVPIPRPTLHVEGCLRLEHFFPVSIVPEYLASMYVVVDFVVRITYRCLCLVYIHVWVASTFEKSWKGYREYLDTSDTAII